MAVYFDMGVANGVGYFTGRLVRCRHLGVVGKEMNLIEALKPYPHTRRLIYGAEIVIGIFALSAFIHAIRWW